MKIENQENKTCKNCNKIYTPFSHNNIFCSNKCKSKWHHKNEKVILVEQICCKCNTKFMPKRFNTTKYCTDKCRTDNWRDNNFVYRKENRRIKTITDYGISVEYYDQLLLSQDNKCKICREEFNDERKPQIDHSHNTGKVRGILCNSCNNGLGRFKDNYNSLMNAAKYIKNNK